MAVAAYQGLVTLQIGALSTLRAGLAAAVAAIQAGVSPVTIPVPPPIAITLSDLSSPPQHAAFVALQIEDAGGAVEVPLGQTEDRRAYTVRAVVGLTVQRTAGVGGTSPATLDGTQIVASALAQAVEHALLSGLLSVAGVYYTERAPGYPAAAPRVFRSGAVVARETRVTVWMQSHHPEI